MNEIKVVAHEEYVVKVGSDALSLSRDEALKLYNELQDVLGLEVPVLEEIIYTPPVYPCTPYIQYNPYNPYNHGLWWNTCGTDSITTTG